MALYFTRVRTGENTLSTSTDGGKGWGTVGEAVLKWYFISQTPEQNKQQQYTLNPNPGHAWRKLGYKIVSLPRYSPDLNPLDFFLWNDINRRMTKCDPKTKKESIQEYKARLRKVAMSTSKVLIRTALANIHKRIAAVYKEKGGHIDID